MLVPDNQDLRIHGLSGTKELEQSRHRLFLHPQEPRRGERAQVKPFTHDDIRIITAKKGYGIIGPQCPVAPGVFNALFKPAPREEPLDSHEAQKAGQGRTLVCITRKSQRLLDVDNLYGGVKPIVDALRYSGLIAEDNPAAIELLVCQKKVRKDQQGTEIVIAPIP